MRAPGALIRIEVTLVGESDPSVFESALKALVARDPELEVSHTSVRQRIILGGLTEEHLELAIYWLQREHRFQLKFGAPQTAYLTTISLAVDQDYTHKRQSGGMGQFARVKIRFEPQPIGTGYHFENAVVGGSVPVDYVPGVMKGLESAREKGPLEEFPVTDFKATLLDGAYHEVDSSALTFEIAARACFWEAIPVAARPVMLEPIMRLEVGMPAEASDDVIADIKTRRAMTLRTSVQGKYAVATALVPLSDLYGYENAFRGLTMGRGSVQFSFERYERIIGSPSDPDHTHPGAAIGLRPA